MSIETLYSNTQQNASPALILNNSSLFSDPLESYNQAIDDNGLHVPTFNPGEPHSFDILNDGSILIDYRPPSELASLTAENYVQYNPDLSYITNIVQSNVPFSEPGTGGYVVLGDGTIIFDRLAYNREEFVGVNSFFEEKKTTPNFPGQEQALEEKERPENSYIAHDIAPYQTYAGADIVAEILVPGEGPMTLGELQTISYSIHRENTPVRTIGHVNARGFVKGPRTIGGSLIFTNFNSYAFYRIRRYMNAVKMHGIYPMADMLPPFDIVLTFMNEYGTASRLRILGVTIVDEGGTMSIDDLVTESTMTYMARGIKPMTPINRNVFMKKELTDGQ